jgi:hypothetical protein
MLAAIKDRTAAGPESGRDSVRLDQGQDIQNEDIQNEDIQNEDIQSEEMATNVGLSDAAIADLAEAMCVPQELFRMIVGRYPELTSALVWRFRNSHQSCC